MGGSGPGLKSEITLSKYQAVTPTTTVTAPQAIKSHLPIADLREMDTAIPRQ